MGKDCIVSWPSEKTEKINSMKRVNEDTLSHSNLLIKDWCINCLSNQFIPKVEFSA